MDTQELDVRVQEMKAQALTIDCPRCSAKKGVECGPPVGVHVERIKAVGWKDPPGAATF